jgi:hypothetical protein
MAQGMGYQLRARRAGGWAAADKLDAGLQFRPLLPARDVRVTFALLRAGEPPIRRVLLLGRPLRPAGFFVTLWLSDAGDFFSLNGLDPIGSYTLVIEVVEFLVGGDWVPSPDPVPAIADLTPLGLGDEFLLPLEPVAGSQSLRYLAPIVPPRLLRVRVRVRRLLTRTTTEQVAFAVSGEATDQAVDQSLGSDAALLPSAVGDERDFHLYVPLRDRGGLLRIEVLLPDTLQLGQLGLSAVDLAGPAWMHSLRWNFSTSPVAGGWVRNDQELAWWETDWTQIGDPVDNSRIHGLRLQGAPARTALWLKENLCVRPIRQPDGSVSFSAGYLYRSRLLRATLRLRLDGFPPGEGPLVTLSTAGFTNSSTVLLAGAGDVLEFSCYVAPQHNLAGQSDAQRLIDFSVAIGGSTSGSVFIEQLTVHELLIGDEPSGEGYASQAENWPQISFPALAGPVRTVHPNPPACPVEGPPPAVPFLINDHGWALVNGRWNLYGIYESGDAIKPMPAGPRADKTIWNTIGPESFFVSGLAHVRACEDGALFSGSSGSELLGYQRPQPLAQPAQQMMVPKGPGELWNLWAPTIIRWQGVSWMFYSSSWGTDIWLASNTDPALSAEAWQYLNADGLPATATRTAVVPASSPHQGRDFNLVRSLASDGSQVFHGYWNGGNPIRVYHMQATSPLAFDSTTSSVAFDLYNSDSGRLDVDSESVFVLYDSQREIYYLAISKDGNLAPGFGVGTMIYLDASGQRLLAGCPASGDRSVLLSNDNRKDPSDPLMIAPRDFCAASAPGSAGMVFGLGNLGMEIRATILVFDQSTTGEARLLEMTMRTNRRTIFSGGGRGTGPTIRTAGRVVRGAWTTPDSNAQEVGFFATDRGDVTIPNGALLYVDGGAQQKIRSNFVGSFGVPQRPPTGDRLFVAEGLGDPTSLFYDGANVYLCCRLEGAIRRVPVTSPPTGPIASNIFVSGLANPVSLADGGDRVFVLEAQGAASAIRWYMKDGSASGVVPPDPTLPYVAPLALQLVYAFVGAGPTFLVADRDAVLAVDNVTGKRRVVADASTGHGPWGTVAQLALGTLWDELSALLKIYWSTDPGHFPAEHFIASMPHHAAEWTCDTTQPGDPWYLSYTRYRREPKPDGTEWFRMFGWGVQEVVWNPAMPRPVGE